MITNRDAGTADEEALDRALASLFDHASVEVTATAAPGELDGVLHRAGSRTIVVAGGDGSLHAVVAALYRRHDLKDAVIGLIPLGTGNDFARAMDVPLDTEEAARLLVEGKPRPVDIIIDEVGGVVVNHVHVGASAQASRRGSRWKTRLGKVGYKKLNLGKLGYPIGAALAAFKPPYIRLRIEVDGVVIVDVDQPVLMVAIGNGPTVGGGAELTPHADPESGKVDVMISHVPRTAGPLRVRRAARGRPAPRARRRDLPPGLHRLDQRRGVLLRRRRRDRTAPNASAPGTSSPAPTPWSSPSPPVVEVRGAPATSLETP